MLGSAGKVPEKVVRGITLAEFLEVQVYGDPAVDEKEIAVVEVAVEHLDDELIDRLVTRITTEVAGINRVLFDYTPKPPATVEYE